jgi:DNA repair protein RecO (recombination protein O)
MNLVTGPAIILRCLDYGEADRIVTFLSRGQGLLKGFARSARRSRKRFGAALEPLTETVLTWSEPLRGTLLSLQEAEGGKLHLELRRDLEVIALASYGCELAAGLCPEGQPCPEIFDLVRAFLDHLDTRPAAPETRLLLELRLLCLSGYAPHLTECCRCGAPLSAETVPCDIPGGALCALCGRDGSSVSLSLPTLGTLARSLQTPPTLFSGFRFSPRTLRETRTLVSLLLRHHLHSLPKSLSLLPPEPS